MKSITLKLNRIACIAVLGLIGYAGLAKADCNTDLSNCTTARDTWRTKYINENTAKNTLQTALDIANADLGACQQSCPTCPTCPPPVVCPTCPTCPPDLSAQLGQANADLATCNTSKAGLTTQLGQANADLATCNTSKAGLTTQLATCNTSKAGLTTQLGQANADLATCNNNSSSLTTQLQKAQDDLKRAQDDLKKAQDDLKNVQNSSKGTIASLIAQLKTCNEGCHGAQTISPIDPSYIPCVNKAPKPCSSYTADQKHYYWDANGTFSDARIMADQMEKTDIISKYYISPYDQSDRNAMARANQRLDEIMDRLWANQCNFPGSFPNGPTLPRCN